MADFVGRLFESPYTALVGTIILGGLGFIALSGRFMTVGYIFLALACAIAGIGLRSLPVPVLISVLGFIGSTLILMAYYLTPAEIPKNTGVLVFAPNNKALEIPYIQFGTSKTIYGPKEMGNNSPVGTLLFPALTEAQFKIEIVDRKYKVSTQIRDQNNKLLVELIRNEWKVAPPPDTWDRNYSDDSLEVKDPSGAVVLQVRAFPDRVQMQGMWFVDLGPPNGVIRFFILGAPQSGGQIKLVPLANKDPLPVIPPMFVYPSDLHLGELRQ
jgi:energy-coupling factor transporter transmembrane protein EcfT